MHHSSNNKMASSSPSKLLRIPVTPGSDAETYTRLRHLVFTGTINNLLYAREPSQKTIDRVIKSVEEDCVKPNYFFLLAKDPVTGEACSGAKWVYHGPLEGVEDGEQVPNNGNAGFGMKLRKWEDVEKDFEVPEPYEESDPRVFKAIFDLFSKTKREVMQNRPYYILQTLVTHPKHERRGAGSLLLKWGCEEADRKGVEAYLEASAVGVPLYERHGFKKVKDITLDLKDFGGNQKFTFTIMVRPPQPIEE